VYPVQLDEEELEALDTIVERLRSSKSEAIREPSETMQINFTEQRL
jgi:metal-responsive CopG/Arc/MetJ family transcriptional regulator